MKQFIKKFFTKEFIIFCIIGVINTLIHLGVYNLYLSFVTNTNIQIILSTSLAFIIASIFSYWANATFTYHEKIARKTMFLSFITFIVKFILNALLTYVLTYILKKLSLESLIVIIPIFVTCILLPSQFLVFNVIFKKKNKNDTN